MDVNKTIPIRGIKQDSYGDKEQEILKNNKEYARKSIKNSLLGSPDFKMFESFLVKAEEQIDANAQKQAKNKAKKEKEY